MAGFHESLPKAELHLHLEGSIEPETLCELDSRLTVEEARRRYRYDDFAGFLQAFKWAVGHLRGPEEYALVTRRLLERLERENVRYAEIILAAGVMLWRGMEFAPIYEAVAGEAARQRVEVRFILDAVRQFGGEAGCAVARLAASRAAEGVVGYGIGGDETAASLSVFSDSIAIARDAGLAFVPHAGEIAGPEAVWDAVRHGARRIGHGIGAAADARLLGLLRDQGIPLEISLSSNVATGAVASLEAHPLRRIYDAGVPVVLNTDDPAMFHTTLSREYELAERHFGFRREELEQLAADSFRHALCEPRALTPPGL